MTDKSKTQVAQFGLSVAHLKGELLTKGLSVGHLAQALGGGAPQAASGNAPATSTPAAGNASVPAAAAQKP